LNVPTPSGQDKGLSGPDAFPGFNDFIKDIFNVGFGNLHKLFFTQGIVNPCPEKRFFPPRRL